MPTRRGRSWPLAPPFHWDAKKEVLVYDGTFDPDPEWTWNAAKGGYEPVETPERVFDRRIGVWIYIDLEVVN